MPDFTKELTIIINEDSIERTASFTVPEDLLAEHSEYFKAACRNEWKEATSRVIKLLDVDIDTFHTYLYWVYRERVAMKPLSKKSDFMSSFNELAKLWLLSDRLVDLNLGNTVMDAMTRIIEKMSLVVLGAIKPEIINMIWSSTTPGRAIRRLVLEYYSQCITAAQMSPSMDELDSSFKQELMLHMMDFKNNAGNRILSLREDLCRWHEHDKQHPECHEKLEPSAHTAGEDISG